MVEALDPSPRAHQPWQAEDYLANGDEIAEESRQSSIANRLQEPSAPAGETSRRPSPGAGASESMPWQLFPLPDPSRTNAHLSTQELHGALAEEQLYRELRILALPGSDRRQGISTPAGETISWPSPDASASELFPFLARNRLVPSTQDRRAQSSDPFERYTTTLGYMPYNSQRQLQLQSSGQDTVTLEEALKLLAATAGKSGGHAGAGELERTSSMSKNLEDMPTGASGHEYHLSNGKTAKKLNHDGSSTSDTAGQEISHVLLGDPGHSACVICHDEFMPSAPGCMTKVTRIEQCGHYFHHACIYKWIVDWIKDSCPICRGPLKPT
ncbi:hypothetical protein PtB15_16B410 [Puccinia triticina]|nr:hypothetical protein PtB15_16B410 [Puccinia triticina]